MRPALADTLDLQPHPEGGWFAQTWVSPESVTLPDGRVRPTATLIHFLLPAGERSAWHRVASDEIWLAHTGTVVLELGGSGDQPDAERRLVVGVAVVNGSLPFAPAALASLVLAVAVAWWAPPVPRLTRHWFYPFYPAHLALIRWLA